MAGAGATLSEGAYRLDFTLGEMTTTTLSHGDQLSQGFQQLWAVITAVDEQTADKFDVSIYPNPTFGIFTIASDQQLQYSIFDFTGKQIMTGEKQGGATEINIGDVQAELFLLVLRDRKGSKVTYKVEVVK